MSYEIRQAIGIVVGIIASLPLLVLIAWSFGLFRSRKVRK
jgi:hypothetical protein